MPEMKQGPKRLGELIDKRTPNSKHFLNDNGSFTAEISGGVIHYLDENDQHQEIGVELYDEDNFDQIDFPVTKHKKASFKARKEIIKGQKAKGIQKSEDTDFHGLKVPFDATIPKKFKKGYSIGKGSDRLTFKPVDAANAIGSKVDKAKIQYENVWTQADVILDLTHKGIKETIILKDETAPTIFSFEVTGPLQDDLTAGSLKLEAAWLQDANGENRDVQQTIRKQGARVFVDLVADVYGLAYPIEIDPTVSIGGSASGVTKDANTNVYGPSSNNGTSTQLLFATSTTGSGDTRVFISFDLSSISGSLTLDAYMELRQLANTTNIVDMSCYKYIPNANWTETGITWNNQPTPGASLGVQTLTKSSSDKTIQITGLQSYVNTYQGQSDNPGIMLVPLTTNTGQSHDLQFLSKEHTSTSYRPKLVVTYNQGPTTPTLTTPNGGETWNESHQISWGAATDAEGQPVKYQLEYSANNGSTWKNILPSVSGNATDVSVVAAAYETKASARPQMLSNGWLVTMEQGATDPMTAYIQVSKNNGVSFEPLCFVQHTSGGTSDFQRASLAVKGTRVYVVGVRNGNVLISMSFDATTQTNVNIYSTHVTILSGSGFIFQPDIAIYENDIHVSFSITLSGQTSKNIGYIKGIINADGTPSWGTLEQVTKINLSGYQHNNPCIILRNGIPHILFEYNRNGTYYIVNATKEFTDFKLNNPYAASEVGTGWGISIPHSILSYPQSSPSAIFVPQSINGLANGRIWAVWQGTDSTQANWNIRVSYSDDGGATWSSMQKLTSDPTYAQMAPSITANKNNEIFVLFHGGTLTTNNNDFRIKQIKNTSGVWGSVVEKEPQESNGPSALFDLSVDFTEPIFIYKGVTAAKVGFYGTWTFQMPYTDQTSYTYNFVSEPETTTAKMRVRAFDGQAYSAWDESNSVFTIQHNRAPDTPTGLTPGGTSGTPSIVSTLTPSLSWNYSDPENNAQSAFQVLIYNSNGTLKHDSGKVVSANKSYTVPAGAALAWGTVYYWNVKVYDSADAVSPTADNVYIKTNQGPTVTVTAPSGASAPGTIFNDTNQPAVTWTYSDPEGNAQSAVEIQVFDGSTMIWSSGEVVTAGTSYTIPGTANLIYDKNYNVKIKAKDNQGTWGSLSAAKYFHLNRSPNAPTGLSPSGTDPAPQIITDNLLPRISWTFSDPDGTDAQNAFQVMIYDTSGALIRDSGTVVSTNKYYDVPASTLLSGKKYYYKVRTRDGHNQWGAYNTNQYFYTNASPNTPLNPAPAGGSSASPAILYDDLTPTLSWTFGDPNSGDVQAAFQFRLYNEAGTLLHDSGEVAGAAGSYTVPNANKLTYGSLYQWEVRTKDQYGAWSNYTSRGWIKVLIGSPTGVSASADNYAAKILVDWSDAASENLSGYNVFRSTVSGGPYTKLNDVLLTQSNYQDSNIVTGQTYYYVIQAVVTGQPASASSAQVSATAIFAAWYIGDFKFEGPSKLNKKRQRAQSKRVVLGKSKQVVQDRGFIGEDLQLEIWLTDDDYSTGQAKYDQLLTELSKTVALNVRDPFGRVWKVAPGSFEDEQLITGKLEYMVKFDLTEVN